MFTIARPSGSASSMVPFLLSAERPAGSAIHQLIDALSEPVSFPISQQ
jgi:hypothetical protein